MPCDWNNNGWFCYKHVRHVHERLIKKKKEKKSAENILHCVLIALLKHQQSIPCLLPFVTLWRLHWCMVCAKELVPVGEVGGVVAIVETMVGLVVGSSSQEGQQSVQSPGQVVATVVLHRQPAVDEMEEGFAQRVAAHHPGAGQSQQQQRQQLGRAGVLGCQSEGDIVLVVQLVDVAVQPRSPGVKQTNSCLCLHCDCTGKSLEYPHSAIMSLCSCVPILTVTNLIERQLSGHLWSRAG